MPGWRLLFLIAGCLAALIALTILVVMAEPPKQLDASASKTGCGAVAEELYTMAPCRNRASDGNFKGLLMIFCDLKPHSACCEVQFLRLPTFLIMVVYLGFLPRVSRSQAGHLRHNPLDGASNCLPDT